MKNYIYAILAIFALSFSAGAKEACECSDCGGKCCPCECSAGCC